MRGIASFIAATAAILLAGAAAADTPLIYRVDRASAAIVSNHLVIRASGAVNSGGWSKPELVKQPSAPETTTIKVKFVARPPASREAVIQALLPISVRKVAPLPRYGAKQVKVIATTNSVTVPITR